LKRVRLFWNDAPLNMEVRAVSGSLKRRSKRAAPISLSYSLLASFIMPHSSISSITHPTHPAVLIVSSVGWVFLCSHPTACKRQIQNENYWIVVRMPQDAPCAYKLQYTAGGPWILLAEMGMGPHPEEVLDVNFQAHQVQLWISESGAQLGWAQVIELEIHGQPV